MSDEERIELLNILVELLQCKTHIPAFEEKIVKAISKLITDLVGIE